MSEPINLRGCRREITKQEFEELAALQCEVPEILGYVGIRQKALESWCRKVYRSRWRT